MGRCLLYSKVIVVIVKKDKIFFILSFFIIKFKIIIIQTFIFIQSGGYKSLVFSFAVGTNHKDG
jgi:uncharacterized SAM-binding protein YcdF (DUF218 family)